MTQLPDEQKGNALTNLNAVRSVLLMIALLSATLGMCGEALITPGADQMFKHFENDNFVNFLLSGPNLVSMFASITAGIIGRYIDKKYVLTFGMALFVAGGVFGMAIDNPGYMIFMRCLVGLALGFTNVTAISIITSMYEDDNRRSRMIGILNAGMYTMGMVITIVSGWVCELFGWKAMFNLYALGIISILLVILFIPRIKADIRVEEESHGPESGLKGWKFKLAVMCVGYWILQVSYAMIIFFVSVYSDETGLGGPAYAGVMTAVIHAGALAGALCFGFVYPKLKRYSMAAGMVLFLVGYIILILLPYTTTVMIGCVILGFALATAFSQLLMRAGIIAPKKSVSVSVGISAAAMGFGYFASTFIMTFLKTIIGVDSMLEVMPYVFVANVVLMIVTFIYITVTNKKEKVEMDAAQEQA